MTEIPQIGAGSLNAAIEQEIATLMQTKLPSLRAIHSAKPQVVTVSYDRDRNQQLRLKAANGRAAHPGHKDIAKAWIEMLESTISPAELLKMKAKVSPLKKGVGTETAAYFAATILVVSSWPTNIPFPTGMDVHAILKLRLGKERGDTIGDVSIAIEASGGSPEMQNALDVLIPSLAQDRGYYWQRCCEKMTNWFQDGGITEISISVPMRPAGEPFDSPISQGTTTFH